MESNGISRCVCPVGEKGVAWPWGPSSRDGFDSGAGVLGEVLNDLRPRIHAGRPPHRRGSYVTQPKAKTKDWKPPQVVGVRPGKAPLRIAIRATHPKIRPRTLHAGSLTTPNLSSARDLSRKVRLDPGGTDRKGVWHRFGLFSVPFGPAQHPEGHFGPFWAIVSSDAGPRPPVSGFDSLM